jgi:hypothetical protein
VRMGRAWPTDCGLGDVQAASYGAAARAALHCTTAPSTALPAGPDADTGCCGPLNG